MKGYYRRINNGPNYNNNYKNKKNRNGEWLNCKYKGKHKMRDN